MTSVPGPALQEHRPNAARAMSALSKVRHFTDLPPHIQAALAELALPRHYAAGQVIYLEGEPGTTVYLLESGWVRATRTSPEGREQALLFLRPGEIFGDIAVFNGTVYPGTVVALEDADVWAIDGPALLDLVARHPELALAVIRRLADRVSHFIGLVEDLSLRSVEARLARTLLRNAEKRDGGLFVPRREWTTFDQMATRLGTVRDVLSRALHTLEEEGLLQVGRHEIVLLNPEGLARRGDK
ncbi:MAG TPA: Crp/Fnr family transcriptional regulator [Anaerolineales bacterium]|nr:Crp/Fnr family transcriptional regulator [Anaerolineales bacterium]